MSDLYTKINTSNIYSSHDKMVNVHNNGFTFRMPQLGAQMMALDENNSNKTLRLSNDSTIGRKLNLLA